MSKEPWSYREGILIGGGLAAAGILLQLSAGAMDWSLVCFPMNVILLGLYILLLLGMHFSSGRVYAFRWLGSSVSAICSLGWVVVATVALGLIRQEPAEGVESGGWWREMVSSWPFLFLYFWMVSCLGMAILRRGFKLSWSRMPFLLNHLGLFIAMVCATLGSGDVQRLTLTARLGESEWRGVDDFGNVVELPFAVELQDFSIEEYPPKLILIETLSGKALPEGGPVHLQVDEDDGWESLLDWELRIERRIPEAEAVVGADTVNYVESQREGGAYAVYVKGGNRKSGLKREGWVSCGSFLFPAQTLQLDSGVSVAMPRREAKRYESRVRVIDSGNRIEEGIVAVNQPLSVEGWKLYQVGYDEIRGRESEISVFEVVRDPWLPVVYVGIVMMMAGAVATFMTAQKRRSVSTMKEINRERGKQINP